ncbi:helix-turn-helix transcriptional regulator [Limosilactobacillus sp. Sa3CUN2]|uniref:Helix-turn-helix transcriptional regulator n=1 Tax=Limosilactobacillus avistercoris TaxID=2762243 RepID=A0ABR8PC30_9LACO|nr:helix-turn-helix transcriptional regulator [Limosilactobacillus avistercoris]MBD7894844.1 helix-turn-helix transcriptional regulator [Limosilactobacillus avistercoris]
MDFAQKIKLYRQKNNWTQQDVAERLNISRKTRSGLSVMLLLEYFR